MNLMYAELRVGPEGLRQLRDDWRRLESRMSFAGPHHGYAYHEALVNDLSPDPSAVSILCLRDEGGTARAILPLQPATRRISRLPVRVWQTPQDPDRSTSDVIADPELDWPAAAATVVACLQRSRPRMSILALDRIRHGSGAWQLARHISGTRVTTSGELYRFRTDQPFEQLVKETSSRFRKNLRRGWRTLSSDDPVSHEIARSPDEVGQAFDAFADLEAAGWKGREQYGTPLLSRPERRIAFGRSLRRLAEAGRCEIHLLQRAGVAVAARILILGRNEVYVAKSTYAEDLAASSPGHLLLEKVLLECCARPHIGSLNLGPEAHWSTSWNPINEPIFTAFAPISAAGIGRIAIGMMTLRGIASPPDQAPSGSAGLGTGDVTAPPVRLRRRPCASSPRRFVSCSLQHAGE